MRHTHLPEHKFVKGQPETGAELANDLERIAMNFGAENIAACIVEPTAGSTGTLVPPKGYLKRLREICDKHGILLIFDEVITAFGRLGFATAAERFGVTPDIMTFAKGITSGTVPMGGTLVSSEIYETFQTGPDHVIDLFHGYTYSGHPLATAAALATLDLYRDEDMYQNAQAMEPKIAAAAMKLKGHPLIEDIRTIGVVAAFDLKPSADGPGVFGYDFMVHAFHKENVMVRVTGDTIALSPPLMLESPHIEELFGKVTNTLNSFL